jgi:hypothetical protein
MRQELVAGPGDDIVSLEFRLIRRNQHVTRHERDDDALARPARWRARGPRVRRARLFRDDCHYLIGDLGHLPVSLHGTERGERFSLAWTPGYVADFFKCGS